MVYADADESVAVGLGVHASGQHASAFGVGSVASGVGSLALGLEAQATADDSVALGANSIADEIGTVSVGASSSERRIVHVAAGTADNDAVIVSQLSPFAAALGGGASFAGGVFTAPSYTIQGNTFTDAGSAFGAVDARLSDLYGQIGTGNGPKGDKGDAGPQGPKGDKGDAGPQGPEGPAGGGPRVLAYDDDSHSTLTLASKGARIANVADGVAVTDAVNKGQLDAQTAQALDSAKTYADAGDTAMLSAARAYTDQQIAKAAIAGFDEFKQQVDTRFRQQDRRIDRIGATGAAWAGLASNTAGHEGANSLGVGFGSQGGRQALAVGYRRAIGRYASVSIGGATSGGEHSVSAGAGFNW